MIQDAQKALKKYFGYTSFRKGQEKIITSILSGNDTFGIMPTGGGKSICYQVPALLLPGITLVISPLISLMKDQVDALGSLGIPASFINSSLSPKEISDRIYKALRQEFKILYVAPERLESDRFTDMLRNIPISLLAIDEAHCVSQWGHDFRPSYRLIPQFINQLENRPIVAAFTATATEEVKEDVIHLLGLRKANAYVTGFNRENLHFSIVRGAKRTEYVTDYIDNHKDQSGIIYAATRKEVDKLHQYLANKGYSVGKYHAGMSDEERNSNQEAFLYDNVQLMIATNAFGMGIDKSNVRYVIHFNMPRNMESYYQEAGRGGRDGGPAECILLYGAADVQVQKFLIEQTLLSPERKANEYKKMQDMVDYCHTSGCLRKYILEYFGEEEVPESCGNCGTCNDDTELADITVEAQKIFSCIKRMGEQYGANLVAGVLKGSSIKKIQQLGFHKLSTYAIMPEYKADEITQMISLLTAEDYLMVSGGQYPVLKLQRKAVSVLQGKEKVFQRMQKKMQAPKEDTTLFDLLRSVRKEISEREKVPPYIIFNDSTLKEMCKSFPVSRAAMLNVPGVGESKLNKYGDRFMAVIKAYVEEHNVAPAPVEVEPQAAPPALEKVPSHVITYNMYKEGTSLWDIAKKRAVAILTIKEHILRCAQEGMDICWSDLIPEGQEALVLEAVKELGAEKLKPLKDALPEEVDYFTIKAVLCKMK